MDEKTIQRIKKLQALAERGVGGEKTTAQKKLAKLLKDTEISARAFASRSYERERQELLKRRAAILKIKASL